MTKLLLTTAMATMLLSNTYAQDAAIEPLPTNPNLSGKYAIKVYNNTTFGDEQQLSAPMGYKRYVKHNQYLSPSVAVQITNRRKNFHEIELSDFSIRRQEENASLILPDGSILTSKGYSNTVTNIALRYEYIKTFAKHSKGRLIPAIGASAQPFYTSYYTTPYTSAGYPTRDTRAGIRAAVIPRLTWYATKRLLFDVNIPLTLVQMEMQHQRIQDPSLPVAQQKYSTMNCDAGLQGFAFRVGAGVKL